MLADWYRDYLGFQLVAAVDLPAFQTRVRMIARDAVRLELIEKQGAAPSPAADISANASVLGPDHLAIGVQDVDHAVATLRRRGVAVALEPMTVPELGVCFFLLRDHERNFIELAQDLASP